MKQTNPSNYEREVRPTLATKGKFQTPSTTFSNAQTQVNNKKSNIKTQKNKNK